MRIVLRGLGIAVRLTIAACALLLAAAFAPTLFGYESLIVTSGSMGDAMPTGSVAVNRLVDVRAVARGDIISFREEGAEMPTTHRVVSIAEENGARVFTTRGDANAADDPNPAVFRNQVHRVEHVVPFAGTLVRHARSPIGGVALFLVPIAGLVLERTRARRRPARLTAGASAERCHALALSVSAPPQTGAPAAAPRPENAPATAAVPHPAFAGAPAAGST